jgi:hypothetical protein
MLPMEEKPPPIPNKNHLQLELEVQQQQQHNNQHHNHVTVQSPTPTTTVHPECDSRKIIIKTMAPGTVKASALSSESSVSSISSSTASQHTMTPTDKPKPKLVVNGSKHASLKR